MAGKSIDNSRMYRLIGGLGRLNSGKILTFLMVNYIKRSSTIGSGFGGYPRKLGYKPQFGTDEAGLPPHCGSYRLAAGTFGARPKLARQWREGKEHMVYPGNPGLGLGRWENEW